MTVSAGAAAVIAASSGRGFSVFKKRKFYYTSPHKLLGHIHSYRQGNKYTTFEAGHRHKVTKTGKVLMAGKLGKKKHNHILQLSFRRSLR